MPAIPPHRSPPDDVEDGHLVRFPKSIAFLAILPLLLGIGFVATPWIALERYHILLIRNEIERAAAPGEPILTDSPTLYKILEWKGSPALREQLRLVSPDHLDGSLPLQKECIVLTTEQSAFALRLRDTGVDLTPDAAQTPAIQSGNALRLSGGPVRIFFAHPANPLSHTK